MPKKKTYGFKDKEIAEQLKQLVGGSDGVYREGRGTQQNRLIRVKTKAACAAANASTSAMSSVSCDRYNANADGTFTDSGYDIDVWNGGGAVASGAWADVLMNEAGLYQFVVVKCA